tara:strand:- start:590 stop:1123 length:534 start_codon:yes stop_codon:yes gene_type:complete
MMGRKLGLLCLKSLIEKRYVIKHLFTHKYEPNSEIVRDDYQDFVSLARENNIPLHVVNKGEEYDIIKNEDFDFIVSCCYRHILPKEVLILPKIMPLNLHYSLLPKYKGEKPLQRALKNKEQETGMTIHKMVETVDEGEIISQARIKIDEGDTVENLYQKLYKVTPRLLIDTLKKLEI